MTGRQEPSADVLLKRLVSRHAHLVGRSSPHVGHAGAAPKKHGRARTVAACALSLLFHSLFDSLLVSSEKASASDELDVTSSGFSPVDLDALEAGVTLTAANPPSTKNTLGLDIEINDVGYIATVQMGTPPRDFKVLMDSGSADLWVGAEGCQSSETPGADCVRDSDQLAFAPLISLDAGQSRVPWIPVLVFIC